MTLTLIFHKNYFCWLVYLLIACIIIAILGDQLFSEANTLLPILNAKEIGPGWASLFGSGRERDGIHSPLERVIQSTYINLFFQGLFWSNIYLFMFVEHAASLRRSQTSAKMLRLDHRKSNSGRALWLYVEECHRAGKDPSSEKIWACNFFQLRLRKFLQPERERSGRAKLMFVSS